MSFFDRLCSEQPARPVSPLLGFGIFILPVIFVWWLLRDGHSARARLIGFGWFGFWVLAGLMS